MASPARIRSTIASVVDQPDDLRELRLFHKALSDINRLRIVQRLAHGGASVGELIDHVGLSQPLVSWHLGPCAPPASWRRPVADARRSAASVPMPSTGTHSVSANC